MKIDLESCFVGFLIGFAIYLLVNRVFNREGIDTKQSPTPIECLIYNQPETLCPSSTKQTGCLDTDNQEWSCNIERAECKGEHQIWCDNYPGQSPGQFPNQSPSYPPLNNDSIKQAVRDWIFDSKSARRRYGDISGWDVSKVTDMSNLFSGSTSYNLFNENISDWDVSSVTNMDEMFMGCKIFDQDISSWDVSSVTSMSGMFSYAEKFNQPLNEWGEKLGKVTKMSDMFSYAENFNQDISSWDVSSVTDMSFMFYEANEFNQNISNWDVSIVTNMSGMFAFAKKFNQPLNEWGEKLGKVTKMSGMFSNAENFNQAISSWDVSSVTDMSAMFYSALRFNQDISKWNVSSVTSMSDMFYSTDLSFKYSLCSWKFKLKPEVWSQLKESNPVIGKDCCNTAMDVYCGGKKGESDCMMCLGMQQITMRNAGCTNNDFVKFCK